MWSCARAGLLQDSEKLALKECDSWKIAKIFLKHRKASVIFLSTVEGS
jgi:hypothetical protein